MLERRSPVEELTARGFGALTSCPAQNASGRGAEAARRHVVPVCSETPVTDEPVVFDDEAPGPRCGQDPVWGSDGSLA